MKRSPRELRSTPPSPRTASLIRKLGAPSLRSAVGMELEELHVGQLGAGLVGQRRGAAIGGRGVGGVAEEPAAAARGQDDGAGAVLDQLALRLRDDPHAGAVFDDQASHQVALAGVDAGVPEGLVEAALDLGAGGVAAGVDDPRPAVGRLPTQRQAAALAVEAHAQRDQLADPGGALLDQDPHRLRHRRVPRPTSMVSAMWAAGESSSPIAAAIPPWA